MNFLVVVVTETGEEDLAADHVADRPCAIEEAGEAVVTEAVEEMVEVNLEQT